MTLPAIRARALVKLYGKELAVAGVDLEVPSGECFGLVGPNGAGKTTTVEMLEGLHRPDGGTIELFGLRWGEGKDREIQQRFGVQLQETQLADKLSVEEVLRLFRSFYYPRGLKVDELLELLDLRAERHKHYQKLSGGQKQRVALGSALCGDPELLFLDEPTTGLDPRARKSLWSVIERFRDKGRTVLITTHYMEEAATLCDRIAIMDQGKIIALGTPRSLVDGLGMVQFVEFESRPLDDAALQALGPVSALEKRGERYRLQIERSLAALQAVLAELERQQVTPVGLSTHQATLDDVFMKLTGRALRQEGTSP